MKRILKTIFVAAIAGAVIFGYQKQIRTFWGRFEAQKISLSNPLLQLERGHPGLENLLGRLGGKLNPCDRPIPYSTGSFDARFGISRSDFLGAIREAEQIWEKPIKRELFVNASDTSTPDTKARLKINLIYDARQDATVKLRKYGMTIRDSRESYDALKTNYESLKNEYAQEKALFDSQAAALQQREDAYNKEVETWSARGGAPPEEYDRLNAERAAIDQDIAKINQIKDDLNAKVDRINAMVIVLNRLAETLNIEVAHYNQIGSQSSGEFEEGVYLNGPTGQEVDIYQFDDRAKLVRVLAHELGHSLDLDHLTNPKAIMYRLNQGANEKPTPEDLAALKKHCGIN
ncbi:MAG: matrixin family metalloprotease [Candidatus Sungbacteria bacterium]|nr:matrixin family metalloprotease [Candidatus Sungbacteria bacterium]